ATVDPYNYRVLAVDSTGLRDGGPRTVTRQRRVDEYAWNAGRGLGQLSRFTVAVSTSLNPKTLSRTPEERRTVQARTDRVDNPEQARIEQNPDLYVDFSIPWNLRVSYNVSYARIGFFDPTVNQTLSFSGDVAVTDKWKVGFTSAYDFEADDFGFTTLNIFRDLHCWQMSFDWIPFGPRQSYTFDINVKASILQDLKLSRRRSWFDR
ncbi:MAG: LPS-assembly protein LptD, partial [Catalinimonas sp.]